MLHVARSAGCALLLLALTTVTPSLTEARQEQDVRMLTDRRAVIQGPVSAGARTGALPFARTELYFGTERPNGVVTEAQFRDFVDQHVTPWFPDGLTLVKGEGRFRGDGSTVVKEESFILILLYPYDTLDMGSQRIERIRTVYQEEFDQQSVLRVDAPFIVWASLQPRRPHLENTMIRRSNVLVAVLRMSRSASWAIEHLVEAIRPRRSHA